MHPLEENHAETLEYCNDGGTVVTLLLFSSKGAVILGDYSCAPEPYGSGMGVLRLRAGRMPPPDPHLRARAISLFCDNGSLKETAQALGCSTAYALHLVHSEPTSTQPNPQLWP